MNEVYNVGCEHIFLVTGRGSLYLSDALARNKKIEAVCVHHEQSASYAAMAYAQATGKMGACLVSTGCASTNAITGVLCAWQDDIPLIVISGQNKLQETTTYTGLPIRTYGQQEANVIELVKSITKYAVMLKDPQEVVYEIGKALYLAKTGRKGPVWIDVPLDIQNMYIDPENAKIFEPDKEKIEISNSDINLVINDINLAKRPVVLIGSGIRSSGAIEELKKFIEKHNLPVVYSASSTDILPSDFKLAIGCVAAMAGNRAANFTIQNSDLVVVLGNRMSTMVTGDVCKFAREAKIIAVDIDPYEHQKFKNKIDKIIVCDVKDFLKEILKKDINKTNQDWVEKCLDWKKRYLKVESQYRDSKLVDLYELSEELTKAMDDDAVFVTDAGLQELILPTTIEFKKNQRCLHPASQGAMGYALPASIGAHYATKKQIVTVIGDGTMMMNIQELQTIFHNDLPIKILIINNDCYAIIRRRQKDLFRTRIIGTDKSNGVSCPDFEKVSKSFGIHYERISSSDELKQNIKNILQLKGSVICEIIAKEDQDYIHSSYRTNENGKFVQPPIEDQSPFLKKEIIKSEMIIKPIDL
jgi:acetolactate synthase-1/2/3 large subunit